MAYDERITDIARIAAVAAGKNAEVAPQLLLANITFALADAVEDGRLLLPLTPRADRTEREANARAIADGFSGGNEQFDDASPEQQERYLMAADALALRPTPPVEGEREAEALEGYRAAVQWIAADSWDGCSDCIEMLRTAASADDVRLSPNDLAAALKRLRERTGRPIPPTPVEVGAIDRAATMEGLHMLVWAAGDFVTARRRQDEMSMESAAQRIALAIRHAERSYDETIGMSVFARDALAALSTPAASGDV